MKKDLVLFHGSPVKIKVGEYLDPAYCGMWENAQMYNPQTGRYDINALYFLNSFDMAMLYAQREIYAPEDATTGTKYFIFNRPDYTTYVYEVNVPRDILYTAMGQRATNFDGEVCCTEPVKIIRRQTFDIARILRYYGEREHINTAARIIHHTPENTVRNQFIAPSSFGFRGAMGKIHFDNKSLIQDLEQNTIPAPGVTTYFYKQR